MLYPYEEIYGGPADRARLLALRDALLADGHSAEAVRYFTAPGRTELGGNHTDHQHGCVLAGAVNLETVADVTPTSTDWSWPPLWTWIPWLPWPPTGKM